MSKKILISIIASVVVAAALWLVAKIDHLPAMLSFPSGAVIAFDLEKCPTPGWEEYKLAHGRFIRGINRSGGNIDPDGERKLGSIQNEQFAAHKHTRPKAVYDAGGGPDSSWVAHSRSFGYGHSNPPPTGTEGGRETRPDNVALLYCEKT